MIRDFRLHRLRPAWHAFRPGFILALALLVIVLGTYGYRELDVPNYSLLDAFYLSLSLFTLAGPIHPDESVQLELARLVAPALTGYAVFAAVLVLFRDNVELLRIRLFARNHVVIAGLGATGGQFVRSLDDAGYDVVAIETDRANSAIQTCRDRGVSVVIGDAADPLMLQRAKLNRARYLVAECGDDRTDMDIASAAAELSRSRLMGTLTTFVALEDLSLWRALTARTLAGIQSPGHQLELFQIFDVAARELVSAHPPFPTPTSTPPHVLLVGLDRVGESLALHVARYWLRTRGESDARLALTVADPDADARVRALQARHPLLRMACDVRPVSCLLESSELEEVVAETTARSGSVSATYICQADETNALTVALVLGEMRALAGASVVVTVTNADEGVARAVRSAGRPRGHVEVFGVLTHALTPDLLFGGLNEVLARAKHEDYLREQEIAGKRPQDLPNMVPWAELDEAVRDDNRAHVREIGPRIASLGCSIVPAPLAELDGTAFTLPEPEVERLALEEHERWRAARMAAGWSYGSMRDETKRIHPDMVDWDRLSEDAKEKDRQPIRDLPQMLRRAGFEIVSFGDAAERSR